MSGSYSRSKGRRSEYGLRDHIRALGYAVDRVPLSGASQGFKGDLRVVKDGITTFVEAKSRANSFKTLYDNISRFTQALYINGQAVRVGEDFNSMLIEPKGHFTVVPLDRYTKRIVNLKKLLGGCDILAVKDDRQPWIFIRYY